jgi:hypothetical protein
MLAEQIVDQGVAVELAHHPFASGRSLIQQILYGDTRLLQCLAGLRHHRFQLPIFIRPRSRLR